MMRFIHISDTHIGPTEGYVTQGLNPFEHLTALVNHLNQLPFRPDFILHSGDIVDDRQAASYHVAKRRLAQLNVPIRYMVGNHDDPVALHQVLLNTAFIGTRFDASFFVEGVQFITLDSRDENKVNGYLAPQQLESLRNQCTPEGPPLVICLHHQPIRMDVPWLDNPWPDYSPSITMPLSNSSEFLEAIRPANHRLRGVFFGHVHRAFQVMQDGIAFFSAPSAYKQLVSWPNTVVPMSSKEWPAYQLVTITETSTIVQQHSFSIP